MRIKNSTEQTAVLLRQFAAMLTAGVPLTRCLDILEKSTNTASLRTALYKIKQKLISGHTLSQSLSFAPNWFDHFTCRLIELGEQTGKIEVILSSLADFYERKASLQRKLKQILFYPCVLSITALSLTLCMMIFVIPSFAAIFHDADINLPPITRAIFMLTDSFNQHLFLVTLIIFTLKATAFYYHSQGKLVLLLHRYLSYLPRVQHCLHTLALLRFTRNLAIALNAGIPILAALQHAANICNIPHLTHAIVKVRQEVSSGVTFHQALSAHAHFPNLLQQMVKVGEESGSLDTQLMQTAHLLEVQLESEITLLTQLLEPLIMLVQGVLIGGLVIGMYLPIFNLGSAL